MATAFTAVVQTQYARVQMQLTSTAAKTAVVTRIHADGTAWPVRGANPVQIMSTTGVGAVIYDHEVPLDQAVTYRAVGSDASVVTTAAVTVPSDTGNQRSNMWLTHCTNPALSRLVNVSGVAPRQRKGRASVLPIVGSADPVARTDRRLSPTGDITVFTTTLAEAYALEALLADGSVLCVRAPAFWGSWWFYALISDVTDEAAAGHAADPSQEWKLAYTAVAPAAGFPAGPVGVTWADVTAAYATWTATVAGEATWNDLMLKPGP